MKKMDEMELQIQSKSLKWSYLYSALFLIIWSCYEWFKFNTQKSTVDFLPLLLLTSQISIYYTTKQIYTKKMSGGEDEE